MRITWALADTAQLDPTIDITKLKNIGPLWGSWKTWRAWSTDNVVCHDRATASDLVNKSFHTRCNMYIPATVYQDVDRPAGVALYNGEFNQLVDSPEDIVSMHLAAAHSDIVLLYGFNLLPKNLEADKMAKHKWHNYKQYVLHLVKDNPNTQWVLLDHSPNIDKDLKGLPNLLFDTLNNVLTQFS